MRTVTIELDVDQMQRLERVCRTTGVEASVAVADALTIYESTLDDDDFRRHFTPDQIAAIEAGLDAIERGDTIPHEQVVAEIKAKFGW